MPARKNNTRLIIGIVAGIIILFLIAVFALTYKAVTLFSEERARSYSDSYEEHEFHDDREKTEKSAEKNMRWIRMITTDMIILAMKRL